MHLVKIKGKYGVKWAIRWRENGQRRKITLRDIASKADAEQALALHRKRLSLKAADLPTDPAYSVGEALEALADAKEGLVKDKQLARARSMARRMATVLGEATPIGNLTDRDVGKVRGHLLAAGLSPFTVNLHLAFLQAAAEKAVKQGVIGHNPVKGIGRVSDDRPPAWRFLTEGEVAKLYEVLDGGYGVSKRSRSGNDYETRYPAPKGLKELVVFLLNTGARLGEALTVTWRDVDFKAGQVRLLTTKKAARGRKAVERYIPMTAELRDMLKTLHKAKPSLDAKVLTVSPHNLRRKFLAICRGAGLGAVRLHDLRHTFCSHLAASGAPIPVIQALAGHATIQMTMRYSHLMPGEKERAMNALAFVGAASAMIVDAVG